MASIEAKYVIVGNSAGGIGAAEAIRAVDDSGNIIIIADEPYPAYSRPMIANYLADRCSLGQMLYRPADFYEKHDIQILLGKKAEKLDVDKHTLKLNDGSLVKWDKLLLGTGGIPIVPTIKGLSRKGVFTFTTLDDAKAIDKFLIECSGKPLRAVVIGGGLIGLSVTEALVKRVVRVTIIEMKEFILNTILDETASSIAAESLRQAGVDVVTGATVNEINGDSVSNVTLHDGRILPVDLVVVAIGVQPRLELVAATPIKTNRGIIVDRHMATSCPDVYACGDVAEAYEFIYGENRLTPIWPNAYTGGRVAGLNMAGVPTEYAGGTAMNSIKYFGLSIASAGLVNASDSGCEILSRKTANSYRKVILKNERVIGMVISGAIEKSGVIISLMKDKVSVDSFKESLVADDFGLISLPEDMRRARLGKPAVGVGTAKQAAALAEK